MARDKDEQYAYFLMRNDFDPDEITRRTGVTPTRSFKKGDVIKGDRLRKWSHWELQSTLGHNQTLQAHMRDVFRQLDQNPTVFL